MQQGIITFEYLGHVEKYRSSARYPSPELKEELRDFGKANPPRPFLPYPTEAPTCWIKYGLSVYWNEVCAQVVACEGLRQLGSSVRAPAVYYAFEEHPMTYIVMEYIPGKTAGKCLKESPEQSDEGTIYRSIALALSELHSIPIPKELQNRPAAVSGGLIRHSTFDFQEAPRHYEDVQQLEDHFNEVSRYPSCSFVKVGKRLPGGDDETQKGFY